MKTIKSPFKLSKIEFSSLLKNRFLRLAVLVVGIIPVLYGALYLCAFWNPYGRLDNIPVAVVNEDSGIIQNDKIVNFGNNLTENLKENKILKWDFVSDTDAKNGLQSHKYFAEIKVPTDFSAKINSASTSNPQQGQIVFIARESNSMIGSQLANRVASQISENLSHEITKEYLDNIFAKTRLSAQGVAKAANGTDQLSQGLESAKTGSLQLDNGSNSAYKGSVSLTAGINQLLLGSKDLNVGIGQSFSGAKTLNDGITQVASGAANLAAGSNSLLSGVNQASAGTNQLINNLSTTTATLATVQSYLADPNSTISDSTSPFNGVTKLQAANYLISSILQSANSSSNQQQIIALQNGFTQLNSGSQNLNQGLISLNSVLNNQVKPGSTQLVAGLNELYNGSNKLESGASDALNGSSNLSNGLAQVSDGTKSLNSGISSAQTGAEELGKQLSDGAKDALQNSDITLTDKLSPVMADPVVLVDDSIDKVPNYGTGFAPYFIPLALWVGSLVLFLLIKLKNDDKYVNPRSHYLGKFFTLAKIGTFQAIILDLVLIFLLGLRPADYFAFFAFSVLISWSFLAILEFLVAAFQDGGKFVGIVLLMLQLTSAGGTYPVQTSPKFFQAINPYLPMTYAVSGLREIISGGNSHNILVAFICIILFMIGSLLLISILSKKLLNSKINLSI